MEKRRYNLIPFIKGEEKAKECGKKGGEASGEVRRERKAMQETMLDILAIDVDGSINVCGKLREVSGLNLQQTGQIATVERWIATGDSKIMKDIAQIIGELTPDEPESTEDIKRVEHIVFGIKEAARERDDISE
jgi:hypothetical protein